MHADAVPISLGAACRLIETQFPQFAGLPLEVLEGGTDHAIYRIADIAVARFPRRAADADACRQKLAAEAEGLGELAACAPVPVPEPLGIGSPGEGYPLFWAMQTFLPGTVATPGMLQASRDFAGDLASLITRLRAADTRGRRFDGNGRGGDLKHHAAWVETCFRNSEGLLDVPRLRTLWERLRQLPREGADVMSHRDLIPGNILVRGGRLAGLLDGGAFGPADPALDLVAGWHMLDAPRRQLLRDALGSGDIEWQRGAAWAFQQAIGLVWYYRTSNPAMSALGKSTLERLLNAPEISSS